MGKLQLAASEAHEKILKERGEITFIDAFVGGYDYAKEELALTWRDINVLERIINNVHYEFRNGIGEKSFGEEVLERFREERDEQEQPEIDLEKEIEEYWSTMGWNKVIEIRKFKPIARYFYGLGQLNSK